MPFCRFILLVVDGRVCAKYYPFLANILLFEIPTVVSLIVSLIGSASFELSHVVIESDSSLLN